MITFVLFAVALSILSCCSQVGNPGPPDARAGSVCSLEIPNSCQGCQANILHTMNGEVCSVTVCNLTQPLTFVCD